DPATGQGAGAWATFGAAGGTAPDQEERAIVRTSQPRHGRSAGEGACLLDLRQCRYSRSLHDLQRCAARARHADRGRGRFRPMGAGTRERHERALSRAWWNTQSAGRCGAGRSQHLRACQPRSGRRGCQGYARGQCGCRGSVDGALHYRSAIWDGGEGNAVGAWRSRGRRARLSRRGDVDGCAKIADDFLKEFVASAPAIWREENSMRPGLRAFFVSIALAASSILPASAQTIGEQFQQWLANDLWPEARSRGIDQRVFQSSFAGVKPNLDLPDLVLPGRNEPTGCGGQHQAEFRAPSAYFNSISGIVNGGRARARQHAQVLARIEQRFGVPRGIVLAVWGRESGFGGAKIPHNAFEVLGTKAFLATRKEMFRAEVLAALDMVQKRGVSAQAMRASWAGALGQPQCMTTSYL